MAIAASDGCICAVAWLCRLRKQDSSGAVFRCAGFERPPAVPDWVGADWYMRERSTAVSICDTSSVCVDLPNCSVRLAAAACRAAATNATWIGCGLRIAIGYI